jgi:hypothetical protein
MASGPYLFPDIPVRGCGKLILGYISVELAKQTINRSGAATDEVPAYSAVDFTSPTTIQEAIFLDIPEIAISAEPELGAFAADGLSLQCLNSSFDTTTRMANILFDDNPLVAVWHIRISYISKEDYDAYTPALRPWALLFSGVIDHEGGEIQMYDRDDEDSWLVEFSCSDALMQLEDSATNETFFNSYVPHGGYSFVPANGVFISWLESGSPNAQALNRFDIQVYDGDWLGFTNASPLHFILLKDLVQALSNSIGITASTNNGLAAAQSWEFMAYDGSTERSFTWSDLCIPSGVKTAISPWYQDHGYFDAEGRSPVSFYNCGSVLEMLKAILVPFGMSARIGENSASARCMYYGEYQDFTSNTLPASYSPAHMQEASRSLYGFSIHTPDVGDYTWGTHGDGGTAIRSAFMTANRIPNCFQWRHDPAGAEPGRCDDYHALLRSLYAYDAVADKVYSIYKINVKTDGNTGNVGFGQGITAEYDSPDAAMVLARAIAAYYFCPYLPATGSYYSDVGIYRRRMRRMEFEAPGVLVSGYGIGQYMMWNGKRWWIHEKHYDLRAATTRLICESGD